jgi:hypothetical protein
MRTVNALKFFCENVVFSTIYIPFLIEKVHYRTEPAQNLTFPFGMTHPNALDPIEFGDHIMAQCDHIMKVYETWNAKVRDLHESNSHLYLREIKIPEAQSSERRQRGWLGQENYVRRIDPLPIALEFVDFQLHHGSEVIPSKEALQFQETHTRTYYERRREIEDRERDRIRGVGFGCRRPDGTLVKVNEIPNSSSKKRPQDGLGGERIRNMRMRKDAFRTAQSTRPDHPLSVPMAVRELAGSARRHSKNIPNMRNITDHEATKKRIEKTEMAMQDFMRQSLHHIRELNRQAAVRHGQLESMGIAV